jgi:hypothetical protein
MECQVQSPKLLQRGRNVLRLQPTGNDTRQSGREALATPETVRLAMLRRQE